MERKEYLIDFFNHSYLDNAHPDRDYQPHFQLAVGILGDISGSGGDPHEKPSQSYSVISKTQKFSELNFHLLSDLKKPNSLKSTYQVVFTERATRETDTYERKVLEEILELHNDFVTPRRS